MIAHALSVEIHIRCDFLGALLVDTEDLRNRDKDLNWEILFVEEDRLVQVVSDLVLVHLDEFLRDVKQICVVLAAFIDLHVQKGLGVATHTHNQSNNII